MTQGFAREARIGVDLHVGETLYYTANDTFAKADYPGLYGVRVRVQAGGGGGGGVQASGTTSDQACSGGGGAGGHAEKIIVAADLATSETVTVGSGGSGGAAGNNAGSAGSSSSFGSHCSATGGGGGEAMTQSSGNRVVNGGDGGVGTGGDLNLNGGNGLRGYVVGGFNLSSGHGGDTIFGPGGKMKNVATVVHAVNPGTGGAGSSEFDGNLAGGDGADGIVIIEVLYERKIAVDEDIHTQYQLRSELEWQDYSPTYSNLTIGNGTVVARYVQIGDTVHVYFRFTLGSSSSIATAPTVSVPVAVAATHSDIDVVGKARLTDTGTNTFQGRMRLSDSLSTLLIVRNVVTGSQVVDSNIGASNPFTWTTGDVIQFEVTYEAAS